MTPPAIFTAGTSLRLTSTSRLTRASSTALLFGELVAESSCPRCRSGGAAAEAAAALIAVRAPPFERCKSESRHRTREGRLSAACARSLKEKGRNKE